MEPGKTGLYRFQQPSAEKIKKKKQLDGMRACMCMQARCLRRSSVSNRSPTALPFFPALSWLLSSWSSLLTVTLCFLQSRCFLDKGLKSSRKFACFSGSVEALRSSCRWRRLSVSTAYDRFINAAVRAWIGQKPFFP